MLVGTERHLHADDIAAETVNAAKHEGLATVVALLTTAGAAGGVQAMTDVTVVRGSAVEVTVEVASLHASFISDKYCGRSIQSLLVDLHFDCDCRRSTFDQSTNRKCLGMIFLTRRR